MLLFDTLSCCRLLLLSIIAIIPVAEILLSEMFKFFNLHLLLKTFTSFFAPLLVNLFLEQAITNNKHSIITQ